MNRGLGQGSQMKMNYEAKPASFLASLRSYSSPSFRFPFHFEIGSLHNVVAEPRRWHIRVLVCAGADVGYFVKYFTVALSITWTLGICSQEIM